MLTRLLAVGLLGGLGAAWYFALPAPRPPQSAPPAGEAPALRGAIHVHTNRSDGTGPADEIAAAAARAGLGFVLFTDHGDGTREPDPPQYRGGVLCVDAVEISTYDGHLLALGLPAAPYPLGGEARDVIEDVRRLGGFAIAAHPGSPKAGLQWSDWSAPVDGLEWLNADSEWRDESSWTLARALFTYPARATETLALLLDRPDTTLRRWDELTRDRRVVAIAAADAHARLGLRGLGEPYEGPGSLRIPSYEETFRIFSNVLPGASLSGDPVADARTVLQEIREGRLYSSVDALGRAAPMSFMATGGRTSVGPGGVMPLPGPVTLHVDAPGPPEARIDLLKDGDRVATATGGRLEHAAGADAAGVYRVEISLPDAPGAPPIPWLLSNPIYVGREATPAAGPSAPVAASAVQYGDGPAERWTIETSPASRAALDVVSGARGTELALRYAVGGAESASPFAAFAMTAGPDLERYDRLVFTARADRPMRISVQLREPAGQDGLRWRRSVYVDPEPRVITVRFDDMRPVGAITRPHPAGGQVDSVLFVIDTTNTPLGGSGRIWIDDVRYAR